MHRVSVILILCASGCASGCSSYISQHDADRATDTTRAIAATASKGLEDRLVTVEQTLRDEKVVHDNEKTTRAAQAASIERYSTLAFGAVGVLIAYLTFRRDRGRKVWTENERSENLRKA